MQIFQAQCEPSTACCFCRLIIILPVKVCLPCLSLIKVINMFEIPHQIQKSFSPVSSINSSQTDIALPVKTCKRNFVTFFVYFGNSSFDYLWNFFVNSKVRSHFGRNFASLASLVWRNWRWLSEYRWIYTLVRTRFPCFYTYIYVHPGWYTGVGS